MMNSLLSIVTQLPLGTPNPDDNEAVDFTDPFNIIVYIIIPVVVVILYIYWKKTRNKND